ncbi:MAG: diguanylate cyclase, partial [Firmicutes bacterium]|nr:diguanylate cyclase [Bacillota bacterium]
MKKQMHASPVEEPVAERDFNQLIQTKIQHSLNIIIPAAIPLVLLIVVNDYLRNNEMILYIDASIAVSLVALTLLKNDISNRFKIIILGLLTIIAGFTSAFVSGYAGAGLMTLLVGCMLVAGFLSKRISILYGLFLSAAVIVFVALVGLGVVTYDLSNPKFNPNLIPSWINLTVVFIISLLVLIVIINVIKKSFGESLRKAEEQLAQIIRLAFYDTLTGLPNKNKLLSDNQRLRGDTGLIVLFSIDGYALIDSIYGQDVTNEIIIAISELLESKKEYFQQYARTDANEFAFVWKKGREDAFLPFVEQSVQEVLSHHRLAKWKRGIHFHLGYYQCS